MCFYSPYFKRKFVVASVGVRSFFLQKGNTAIYSELNSFEQTEIA